MIESGPPQRSTPSKVTASGIDEHTLTRSLLRIVLFVAAVVIALWFLSTVLSIVLLFLTAFIFSLALNGPVTWLERQGWRRGLAVLAVLLGLLAATFGVAWLIVPRLVSEVGGLVEQLPALARRLAELLTAVTGAIPGLEDAFTLGESSLREALPSFGEFLGRIGSWSLSALGALVFVIVLISAMIHSLLRPQPLLRTYLQLFPAHRRSAAEQAFTEASRGVVGWIRANVIIGGIEAVAVGVVLGLLGVPGAVVWAALAFFAELVPKLGPYLMSSRRSWSPSPSIHSLPWRSSSSISS